MGNYASTAELQTRFENVAEVEFLTDKDPGTGVDEDVLVDVLEAAEAEINSGIGMRYLTPVDVSVDVELTALLKRKTLDIAEVYLHRRGEGASEIKLAQLEQALAWIEQMSLGKRVLIGALTAASTASRDPRATFTDSSRDIPDDSGRIFTRRTGARL